MIKCRFYSVSVSLLSHLILPASVFLHCIPPLLQYFHFQLLYKLLLILIQPCLLLQLKKKKENHTLSIFEAAPHVCVKLRTARRKVWGKQRLRSCFYKTTCQDRSRNMFVGLPGFLVLSPTAQCSSRLRLTAEQRLSLDLALHSH